MKNDQTPEDLAERVRLQVYQEDRELSIHLKNLRKFTWNNWLVSTIGLIVFSQGLSFMRWNKWVSMEDQFNEHAFWIAVIGFAIMSVGVCLIILNNRVKEIEKILLQRNEKK